MLVDRQCNQVSLLASHHLVLLKYFQKKHIALTVTKYSLAYGPVKIEDNRTVRIGILQFSELSPIASPKMCI